VGLPGGLNPGVGIGNAEGEVGDDEFVEFEAGVDFAGSRRASVRGIFEIGDGGEGEFVGGEGVVGGDGRGEEAISGEAVGEGSLREGACCGDGAEREDALIALHVIPSYGCVMARGSVWNSAHTESELFGNGGYESITRLEERGCGRGGRGRNELCRWG